MAVFRIEKTDNYTVMSNHHLRNEALTLKAKGLMSQMLSLPENWDYTLKGLSHINRENIDAIRTAVLELESAGYIDRRRARKDNGQLGGVEYVIREQPALDLPILENPTLDNPTLENPTLDNPTQLNIDTSSKDRLNTDLSNTDSIPFQSSQAPHETETDGTETGKKHNMSDNMSAIDVYREVIHENIDYGILISNYPHDREHIDEIAGLILETICTSRKVIRIAKDDFPAEYVKAQFMKLNSSHIEFAIDCLRNNTTKIRNIKKYMLAVLFNALTTMSSYYTALVAHDEASEN